MPEFRHLQESSAGLRGLARRAMRSVAYRIHADYALQVSLRHRMRETVIPKDILEKDLTTDVPSGLLGDAGIDLNVEEQIQRVRTWTDYQPLFELLRQDARINVDRSRQAGLIRNEWYESPDAEIYAAMIAATRPTAIVEVGSGFSTLIARRIVDELRLRCEIVVVDPEPRTDIEEAADRVLSRYVEDVAPADLPAAERLLLFIDSSHVIRARGDVPHIYIRLLPALPSGTVIHVHDVFIPYDYPFSFQHRLYTEQYLVHCLLADSNRYRVLLATHYLTRTHPGLMQRVIHAGVGQGGRHFGASLWLEVL